MDYSSFNRICVSSLPVAHSRLAALSVLVVILLLSPQMGLSRLAHAELQVEGNPEWGLDGNARAESFNLLTVRMFNNSDKPWSGDVWLNSKMSIQTVDVPLLLPDLYIEPYGVRQIQLFPFVNGGEDFALNWGQIAGGRFRSEDSFSIDGPRTVFTRIGIRLVNQESSRSKIRVPAFDADLFPASAVVLERLERVYLDHVPVWQSPQTQAFRDWLASGGTLYLQNGTGGEPLNFDEGLSELNEPSDRFPFEYGVVVRVDDFADVPPMNADNPPQTFNDMNTTAGTFSVLKRMTRADHSWPLIYSMAVVYLLILFPGCWLIGRRRGDYRVTYAVVLTTVVLFSFGFQSIGKRGYGEQTSIHSVAIAQPGQPGRWIVKQWANVFITDGGNYRIEFDTDAAAISTGQTNESVRGIAFNQPIGVMQTDIPSFSNRSVIHTGVLTAAGPRPRVKSLKVQNNELQELILASDPNGESLKSKVAFAIYKSRIYRMEETNGTLILRSGGKQISVEIDFDDIRFLSQPWYNNYYSEDSETDMYAELRWPLLVNQIGILNEASLKANSGRDDAVQVYLYQKMPESFFAVGDVSPLQSGQVLYSFTLPIDAEQGLEESNAAQQINENDDQPATSSNPPDKNSDPEPSSE